MIRKRTLLTVDDETQQICCTLSQTGCNCECPSCVGCVDCVDCVNLTIANVAMLVYKEGDVNNITKIPNYLLTYGAFTLVGANACFYIDSQLISLPMARYIGEVQVNGIKAGKIHFFLGRPYSVCEPYVTENIGYGSDMQP